MNPAGDNPDASTPSAGGSGSIGQSAEFLSLFTASDLEEFDEDAVRKILDGEDDIEVPEDLLLEDEDLPEEPAAPAPITPPAVVEEDPAETESEEEREKRLSLFMRIKDMKVSQRIKLALRGGREARGILIRDANKVIKRLVMMNPRFTEDEVVRIANNRSEDSDCLEMIAKKRDWAKLYRVRLSLVRNPKTPIPLAVRFVSTLMDRDLKLLAKSKNVPGVVNSAAKRLLFQRQDHR